VESNSLLKITKIRRRNLNWKGRDQSEYNIRMDLTEIAWDVVEWIHLAQDKHQWWAVVNTVMNLRVP
jgi:hypothetical protein